MPLLRRPASIEGQMMTLLAVSFAALLALLAMLEFIDQNDIIEWAQSDYTTSRLHRVLRVLPHLRQGELKTYIADTSRCHDGYTLTSEPYPVDRTTEETQRTARGIAKALSVDADAVRAGLSELGQRSFSYSACAPGEIDFPIDGLVVSVRTEPGRWLNAEIHPHEWHFTPSMAGWLIRSGAAFLSIGVIAFVFVRRIAKPLNELTDAARAFGGGLQVAEVPEAGPPDMRRAIHSFNAMQSQVAEEVARRTNTLAAISHDIRAPLTALRIKAELLPNQESRTDLLSSVAKMERITATALEFLKGESRSEPMRRVDLVSLVESECHDFVETGEDVVFHCAADVHLDCRPDALSRAVRNLVENAVKYAGEARVTIQCVNDFVTIAVSDNGPGIAEGQRTTVMKPFARLSTARESHTGGFGLGLAIVKAVAEGHGGSLTLRANTPHGLTATITLPLTPASQ